MCQTTGESVEDFLRRLENETFKSKVPVDIQVQMALKRMDIAIEFVTRTRAPKH